MDCGWLRTGDTLAGKPVRLRVVVLRARPRAADPDPVVYIPGGPGAGAGLDARALRRWRRWQQRAGWPHDIVLFDPRATGQSSPRPDCAMDHAARAAASRATPSRREFADQARAARRCYRQLGARIAAALGPDAQIRDLRALIDALGVARVNLWAVSYGTRIARVFARRYSARVRALVLDSLVATSDDPLLTLPAQVGGAIARLDHYCAARPGCATGDAPTARVQALLARYAKQPPTVTLTRADGTKQPFVVTPYRLLMMIVFAGYDAAHTPDTIARLARAQRGRRQALRPLAERLWRRGIAARRNKAVFWSTRCAFGDGAVSKAAWQKALAGYPTIAPYIAPARGAAVCRFWQVPRIAREPEGALAAPTLVVAGGADTLTPAAAARAFVRNHAGARLLSVPSAGHVATFVSACAQAEVGRFWAAPRSAQSPDCTD